jgi:hypothetical protein
MPEILIQVAEFQEFVPDSGKSCLKLGQEVPKLG